jgi:hypothetical protein
MRSPEFNIIPEGIFVNEKEKNLLLDLAQQELNRGALAFGVFGSRTYSGRGEDIDVIIIKYEIPRRGLTKRDRIFHLNYFSPDSLKDPIATFAKQAYSSAVFIFNHLT